jgi:hypothetical protein
LARAVHRGSGWPRRDSAHPIPAWIPAARSEAQQRPRQFTLRSRTTWRLFPVGRRPKVFQYTAINDHTRYGVFRLYTQKTLGPAIRSTRRSAPRSRFPSPNYRPTTTPNSHSYLRSQANRRMRPRYIKPRCPVQNGKVERSHRIDEEELLEFPTFAEFSQRSPRLLHPLRHHSPPENHLDPPQLLNTHRHTAILSSDYPTLF